MYDISGSVWDFKGTQTAPAPQMLYYDQSALLGGTRGAKHILKRAGALPVSEALSVCPQIVRQQTLLNTMNGANAHTWVCSTWHNAAHSQRETQNKQIIFLYSSVFIRFNKSQTLDHVLIWQLCFWYIHQSIKPCVSCDICIINSLSWLDSGIHAASRKS